MIELIFDPTPCKSGASAGKETSLEGLCQELHDSEFMMQRTTDLDCEGIKLIPGKRSSNFIGVLNFI